MVDRSMIFPAREYRARVARMQSGMAEQGLDALLLTTPPDIFYTCGFLTRFWESPARPWFIVIGQTADPVAVIPSIGADLMGRTWLTDIRTWDAPDPNDDGVSLLADTLAQVVPPRGRIGLPMGLETHLRMPLRDYEDLRTRLEPRRFADATACVNRVREVKSVDEIAKIRATCAVAARAFARMPEFACAGRPLADVFRDFQIALLGEGADWISYVAGGAGPDGYRDVISPPGRDRLQGGDILMLDTGAVRDGYFCDLNRNFVIGTASDTARRCHAALWQATEDTLAALRPGLRACDVHRALSEGLERQGATPPAGRLGHGLGVTLTEWPSFTPLDSTPLRAGMVLALEPVCMTRDGRIMVHEENVVMHESGAELLSTRTPHELPEITP